MFRRVQYDDLVSQGERNGGAVLKDETGGCLDWFANLNTPEEFAEAERHGEALDA